MRNLKIHPITFVFLICFTFLGCNNSQGRKETKRETIKIGAILPLTGDLAFLGTPIKIAMDIAIEEINSEGEPHHKNVNVVYEDSKGLPTEGVTAAKKLVEIDRIPIVTTFLTGVSAACKPITEASGALLLAQTVSPSICDNSKLTIRFHYSFTEEGKILRDFIVYKNPSRVFLIHSSDPSTSFEVDSLIIPGLRINSINWIQEKFNIGTKDFKTIAAKIKTSDCNLIYIAGYGNDIALLLKELNSIGVNAKNHTICGNIGFIEIPRNVDKKLYEQTVFTAPPFMVSKVSQSNATVFNKKYRKISGQEEVGYAAYYAYDLVKILGGIMKNQKTQDPMRIRKALVGEYEGLGGKYTINSLGDVKTEVTLGTMKNGIVKALE